LNGFPFSMPSDLKLIDHHPIALQPGLALYHPVEMFEKTRIVADRRVVADVLDVRENGRRRIFCLRQRGTP